MSDSRGEYIALVRQQGAPEWDGYNPIAPRSHRWMMDFEEDDNIRYFGWALWRSNDYDPKGKMGPPKEYRTYFAHDSRVSENEWLGLEHAKEDLGMTLAEAIAAQNLNIKNGRIKVDEDGRIIPNGDAPLPRRIKSKNKPTPEDDLFRTECFPQPLRLYFANLDSERRKQYVRLYRAMDRTFSEYLKTLEPEKRVFHTWDYLQAAEYDEQLDADAIAAARAAHVKQNRMAAAGWVSEETRGRKPVSRELTIKLEIRVDADTYRSRRASQQDSESQPRQGSEADVENEDANSVQNDEPNSYTKSNGSVRNSASLLKFSNVTNVPKHRRGSGNVENGQRRGRKEVAAKTPRSKNPSSLQTLPDEDQNSGGAETARSIGDSAATAGESRGAGFEPEFEPNTYNAQLRALKSESET